MRAKQARKGKEWSGKSNKKRNITIVLTSLICIVGLAIGLICSGDLGTVRNSPGTESTGQPIENGVNTLRSEDSGFRVTFLDVGQGDCAFIACEGHYMLIDGGPDWAGTRVQKFLQNEGVQRLDYLVGTHFDADHIGGLDVVAYKFDCDTVLLPEYDKSTKTYEHLQSVIKDKGLRVKHPLQGDRFALGSADITVLSPLDKVYEDDNDYSIVLMIEYAGKKLLFMGDATGEVEQQLMESSFELQADILKVAHHGSTYSTSMEFASAVGPEYAVISCGAGNDYGHPHKAVLDRLKKCDTTVFRTDENGNIAFVVTEDGEIRLN